MSAPLDPVCEACGHPIACVGPCCYADHEGRPHHDDCLRQRLDAAAFEVEQRAMAARARAYAAARNATGCDDHRNEPTCSCEALGRAVSGMGPGKPLTRKEHRP